MTAWPKARVCGRSLAEIAGSNPAGSMDVCCECCVMSGRADHSAIGVPPSGVPECDREAAIMERPCPTKGSCAMVKKSGTRAYSCGKMTG